MARQRPILARVGERVRELRLARGYSQRELGRLAKKSRTQIAAIEAGEKAATIVTLEALATALKVPVSSLMGERVDERDLDRPGRLAAKLRERPSEYVELLEAALRSLDRAAELARKSSAHP